MDTSKICIIVNAGHGGNHPVTGQYMTAAEDGKFYQFLKDDGSLDFEIREGVINRQIAKKFSLMAQDAGFDVQKVYHPYLDTHRAIVAQKANQLGYVAQKQGKKVIYLSFHSNALSAVAKGKGSNARGFSVFTTRGLTESDKLAQLWFDEMKKLAGNRIVYRQDTTDGDSDWEADFTEIYFTWMPAVLVENLFFDNHADALILQDPTYQTISAQAALNAVIKYFS